MPGQFFSLHTVYIYTHILFLYSNIQYTTPDTELKLLSIESRFNFIIHNRNYLDENENRKLGYQDYLLWKRTLEVKDTALSIKGSERNNNNRKME